jgi:2-C-methyl-D-erythritol 2,4-cyclodiphosphate synthase
MRVGQGYDIHRLVPDRPLMLGGVAIPSDLGLLGHSDGDVVLHAVGDALLGAAALGDIGQHFPDTDPDWRGADSADLLARIVALVRETGYVPVNADISIVAERPRLGEHRDAMRSRIADLLGLDRSAVSVKARTNEGLDAVGRGEAIAVHAVALLEPLETE